MSTPIETNTEELREILQTVYNLPNAGGGGSAEPDLVITLDPAPDLGGMSGSDNNLSFDHDAVVNTYTKILSGQPVNCVLNAKYYIASGTPVDACSPQITAIAAAESNNSARVGFLNVFFYLWMTTPAHKGTLLVDIGLNVHGNGTASVSYMEVTQSVPWGSAFA